MVLFFLFMILALGMSSEYTNCYYANVWHTWQGTAHIICIEHGCPHYCMVCRRPYFSLLAADTHDTYHCNLAMHWPNDAALRCLLRLAPQCSTFTLVKLFMILATGMLSEHTNCYYEVWHCVLPSLVLYSQNTPHTLSGFSHNAIFCRKKEVVMNQVSCEHSSIQKVITENPLELLKMFPLEKNKAQGYLQKTTSVSVLQISSEYA